MDVKLEEVSDLFLVDGPPLNNLSLFKFFIIYRKYLHFFVLFIFHIVNIFYWLLKRTNRSCYFNFLC